MAQRFERDDYCSRINARKPNVIWLIVKKSQRWRNDFSALRATISAWPRAVPSPADLLAPAP
jgi:hypothetical protein